MLEPLAFTNNYDPVVDYAEGVLSERRIAGPHVRAACRRFMSDLQRADLYYDIEEIQRVFDFYQIGLKHTGGQYEGDNFLLHPWQGFVLGNLFGWYYVANSRRRFRWSYDETAKGSGKTPLAAGLSAYMVGPENEPRAEAYIIGETYPQAQYSIQYTADMLNASDYAPLYDIRGGVKCNSIIGPNGFIQPVAKTAESKGKSGFLPNFVLCEEYHEHSAGDMLENLAAGVKSRRNPLVIVITNSGFNMHASPCGMEHMKAVKIAHGDIDHDQYFAYVCALDDEESDKFFTSSAIWPKANPGLPDLPGEDYIRDRIKDAEGSPEKVALVKRRNACVWTEAKVPWLPDGTWSRAEIDPLAEKSEQRKEQYRIIQGWLPQCRRSQGLDLSRNTDLSALADVWDLKTHGDWTPEYPEYFGRVTAWMPSERVEELSTADNVPYRLWVEQEYIQESMGKIIETYDIAEEIKLALYEGWFEGVAYDPYRMNELKKDLANMDLDVYVGNRWAEGLKLFPHARGLQVASPSKEDEGGIQLWMTDSIRQLKRILLKDLFWVEYNPCLRWGVAGSVVETNKRGNQALDKDESTSRVDTLEALIMAAGLAVALRRLAGEYVISKTLDVTGVIEEMQEEAAQ